MMRSLLKNNINTIKLVSIITLLFISSLSISHYVLNKKITHAEQEYYNNQLKTLLKKINYNNNILKTKKNINNNKHVKALYTAKYNNIPTAVIVEAVTPDGYNGDIKLLVSIELKNKNIYNNRISDIKVLQHQETPGLGDKIESNRSNWITHFYGENSVDTINNVDSITGATITSNAVKDAINNSLIFVNNYEFIE